MNLFFEQSVGFPTIVLVELSVRDVRRFNSQVLRHYYLNVSGVQFGIGNFFWTRLVDWQELDLHAVDGISK